MNATELARQAYAPALSPLRIGRSAELQVITTITARLRAAAAAQPPSFPHLVKAIHENRQLWIRLAADVADADNPLPQQLRARIFYLAEFTQVHSSRVLRGKANVDALVEINTAVMRGLSATPVSGGVM